MDKETILSWLKEEDPKRLEKLWQEADKVRARCVGDEVHLRGLIEISNYCINRCYYCGINRDIRTLARYRMTEEEIMAVVREIVKRGYGTVVLQSGEDPGIKRTWMSELIRRIKGETPLAVTLSLGERNVGDFAAWRKAGADRYLLKFETSNRYLYRYLHPPRQGEEIDRLILLEELSSLGYEVGSGIMVGLPGQTYEDLYEDLSIFRRLDLDMIGIGPFIPHPKTPLGCHPDWLSRSEVPNTDLMTCKVIALTRLLCPMANIPSTTALATVNPASGRILGLERGANVIMPNFTPIKYRKLYDIYPRPQETAPGGEDPLSIILSLGRRPGKGPGNRRRQIF